jgi:iron(III) transport system ATP-binding protein
VRKSAYLGNAIEYTVDCAVGALFVVTDAAELPLAVGAELAIAFSPYGVIALPPE